MPAQAIRWPQACRRQGCSRQAMSQIAHHFRHGLLAVSLLAASQRPADLQAAKGLQPAKGLRQQVVIASRQGVAPLHGVAPLQGVVRPQGVGSP